MSGYFLPKSYYLNTINKSLNLLFLTWVIFVFFHPLQLLTIKNSFNLNIWIVNFDFSNNFLIIQEAFWKFFDNCQMAISRYYKVCVSQLEPAFESKLTFGSTINTIINPLIIFYQLNILNNNIWETKSIWSISKKICVHLICTYWRAKMIRLRNLFHFVQDLLKT